MFSCINSSGCSETTQTYVNYNKATVDSVKSTARAMEKGIPEPITHVLLPIYSVYTARAVVLAVNSSTIVGVSNEIVYVSFNYGF